jgi:hypothetical protein
VMTWVPARISLVRQRRAVRANFLIARPVRFSIHRLTATAANTTGEVGFDRIALAVVDRPGLRRAANCLSRRRWLESQKCNSCACGLFKNCTARRRVLLH